MTDREKWEKDAAETRKALAEGKGITFPNAEEAIKWLKSPEPTQDKVEAIAKILCYSESNADVEEDLEYYRGVAREILKLFPSVETARQEGRREVVEAYRTENPSSYKKFEVWWNLKIEKWEKK